MDDPKIETETFNLNFSSSISSTKPVKDANGPSQTFTFSPISKVIPAVGFVSVWKFGSLFF